MLHNTPHKLLHVFLLAMPSCLVGAADAPIDTGPTANFRLIVDSSLPEAKDEPQVMEAWLRYAATRMKTYNDLAAAGRHNKAVEDYEIELAARRMLASFWSSQQARGTAVANAYLDKLVEIDKAGFLEEYVLYFFVQPGWTVSAASLALIELEAFAAWGNANLGGIDHPTLVAVESKSPQWPQAAVQPGATLADPALFAATGNSCMNSTEELNAAGAQWTEESKALDGAPLAAAERSEFIYLASQLHNAEPFRTQGMVWVSDRPGRLTYLAGFCAVEAENFLDAEWWLRMATALKPLDAGIQTELVHVLIFEKRFDDADALIDQVMSTAKDPCDLAGVWRRRGYIRFEQGKMEDARAAYVESLEFDPGNNLALGELQLIDRILLENGAVVPPAAPPSTTTLSTCQAR
jgi:tetratricopeptide (TPR) repeat protein